MNTWRHQPLASDDLDRSFSATYGGLRVQHPIPLPENWGCFARSLSPNSHGRYACSLLRSTLNDRATNDSLTPLPDQPSTYSWCIGKCLGNIVGDADLKLRTKTLLHVRYSLHQCFQTRMGFRTEDSPSEKLHLDGLERALPQLKDLG